MARSTTTHVLEIESGIGEPAFIPLTLGQEVQPISVGKKGMWRIESPRVLDVHAFVYFDGDALFLQSADEASPALVDGYPVGTAWTEVHAPCRLEIGQAKLAFRSLVAGAEGQPRPPAPPPPAPEPVPSSSPAREKPERPFRPGELVSAPDGESTRVAPVEQTSAGRRSRLDEDGSGRVRPAAGIPPPGVSANGAYPAPSSPPGMMPGSMPPGAAPGSMPPGVHPGVAANMVPAHPTPSNPYGMTPVSGHYVGAPGPRSHPPAAYPRGAYPPGAYPPAAYPPGAYPPAAYPPGAYPPAAYPPGAYPPGAHPPGAMPYGASGMPSASGPPGPFPSTTVGTAAAHAPAGFAARWNQMPPIRRLLIVLSPLFLASAYYTLMGNDGPPPRKAAVAALDAGAVTASAPPIQAPALVSATSAAVDGGAAPYVAAPTSTAQPGVAPTPSADPVDRPGQATTTAPTSTAAKDVGALRPGQKTLERQAIDAYALGDYASAAVLYERLAATYPNNIVYVEAARIIRMKIDGGAR